MKPDMSVSLPQAPAQEEDNWVWLARIRHTQGRKGEVFAEILTDFPEKFATRKQLWLLAGTPSAQAQEVELVHHWLHKDGVVLHFAGIDSINDAETLLGRTVAIPMSERAPLGEDEVYISDLLGCELYDLASEEPRLVGVIQSVDREAGPVALLVLKSLQGEVLVPFAKSFFRTFDLEHKRIEMALPEGLVELNTPGKPL